MVWHLKAYSRGILESKADKEKCLLALGKSRVSRILEYLSDKF